MYRGDEIKGEMHVFSNSSLGQSCDDFFLSLSLSSFASTFSSASRSQHNDHLDPGNAARYRDPVDWTLGWLGLMLFSSNLRVMERRGLNLKYWMPVMIFLVRVISPGM